MSLLNLHRALYGGASFPRLAFFWTICLGASGAVLAEASEKEDPVSALLSIDQLGVPAIAVLSFALYLIRVTHKFSVAITEWKQSQELLKEAAEKAERSDRKIVQRVRKLEMELGVYDPNDDAY